MDALLPGSHDAQHENALIASLLDGAERQRAERFLRPGDGRRWSRVRARLRQLLGEHCGVPPAGLRFGYGAHGKPFLASPALRSACRFNVSHAHRRALIVLGERGELGVDIERIEGRRDTAGLVDSVLDASESAEFAALPETARDAGFIRAWVRKEAVLKALGSGIGFGLPRVHVGLGGRPALRIDGAAVPTWRLLDLVAPDGYRAALCEPASREPAPREPGPHEPPPC